MDPVKPNAISNSKNNPHLVVMNAKKTIQSVFYIQNNMCCQNPNAKKTFWTKHNKNLKK